MAQLSKQPGRDNKKASTAALQAPAEHRGNRHGRSEAARVAILEAADNLLVERGFAGVTMEGIAAAAGVAKQTIYRWWRSKTDVLMDAFLDDVAEVPTPPTRGSLEEDLKQHLRALANLLADSDTGTVFRALHAESQHDSALALRLRTEFIEPQRIRDLVPFQHALQRGELSPQFDVEAAAEELVSPIYYRVLVSGQPVSPLYVEGLVRRALGRPSLEIARA